MKMQHKLKNNNPLQFISLPLWQHHGGWDVRLTWSSSGFSSRAAVLGTQDPQFSLPQWLKSQVFLQMWNPIGNPEAFNTEDSIHLQGRERDIIVHLFPWNKHSSGSLLRFIQTASLKALALPQHGALAATALHNCSTQMTFPTPVPPPEEVLKNLWVRDNTCFLFSHVLT